MEQLGWQGNTVFTEIRNTELINYQIVKKLYSFSSERSLAFAFVSLILNC